MFFINTFALITAAMVFKSVLHPAMVDRNAEGKLGGCVLLGLLFIGVAVLNYTRLPPLSC